MKRQITLVAVALLVSATVAQQVRQTRTGKLTFRELTWDFAKNTITMTGDPAVVTIEGRHHAELRAPRVDIDADQRLREVHGAVAHGAVRLNLLTAPDQDGRRRRVEATCTRQATYSQSEQQVVMTGDVKADIITLPEEEGEAAHLEDVDKVVVDLATSVLTAHSAEDAEEQGTFTVTTDVDLESEEQ
ncbi:MAG: hypothetical protein U9R79_15295 [Armatimonadota bacterium]|nr:hypothetical protein [Armatimonadota bacterium]